MSSELELPRIALFPVLRAKLEIRLAHNSDRPKTKVAPCARDSLLRIRSCAHDSGVCTNLIKLTFKLHSDLTNRLLSQTNSTRPRPGLVSFISPPRGPRLQSFSPSSPRDALLTRASSTSLDSYVYLYFLCQSLRSCVKLRRRSRSISALQRRTKHRVAAHASLTTFRDSRTWTLTSPTTGA